VAAEAADVIEREVRIAARPETVFAFLTDPSKMVRWMGMAALLEPRPGGTYRVAINERIVARGQYVEVIPPRRIIFTFGWERESPVTPGSSTVEVTLIPDGEATILRLVHRGLPAAEVATHTDGWNRYLARLLVAAPGGDPGPDPLADPRATMS
jgi:uncharacterized protein YndB with AHSA1/START domain